MERHELLEMMAQLKLAGMRAAYDEILADGLKRRHPVQQIIGAPAAQGRDRRQEGAFHQVPDGVCQVADRSRNWPTSTSLPRPSTSR